MGKREEKKEAIRNAIVDAAGRKMREQGFHGIGVDALAEEAGYTSGAFYSQFGSKQELLIEVLRRGFESMGTDTTRRIQEDAEGWYPTRQKHYLSMRHRNSVAEGCLLPNLSVDAARGGKDVQDVYEEGLQRLVDIFSNGLSEGRGPTRRERAIAAIALMAGGMILARGVHSRKSAEEILDACRSFLL